MRMLMLAALLLTTMPVAAQKWVAVYGTDATTFYIDPGAIRVNGHLRRAWEVHDLKKRDSNGAMSLRFLHEYDCREGRHRILSIWRHSEPMAGGYGSTTEWLSQPMQWDYVAPRTVVEIYLNIVCAVRQ